MNEYKEAYENVKKVCKLPFLGKRPIDSCGLSLDKLNELVEKATPKKPIKRYYTTKHSTHGRMQRVDILCPCCKSYFVNGVRKSVGLFASRENNFIDSVKSTKYCMFCGQAIDWSDE